MKKSLAITLAAAALILVAAFAALTVLTALAGQQSGLDRSSAGNCYGLTPAAARAATDPDHGRRPNSLARCTTSRRG